VDRRKTLGSAFLTWRIRLNELPLNALLEHRKRLRAHALNRENKASSLIAKRFVKRPGGKINCEEASFNTKISGKYFQKF